MSRLVLAGAVLLIGALANAQARTAQQVLDLPTRAGVTQRLLVLAPPDPKAATILLAGGHGGLRLFPNGSMRWGEGNFLVRSRQLFADQGFLVVVLDAPSDRQALPFLGGFRQTPEHVADLQAVIAWLRETAKVPVWIIGTSRGTQSAAHVATQLRGRAGPDGVVLTSTIVSDDRGRAVPAMALGNVEVPVLVVHHARDACKYCAFSEVPAMMAKFQASPRSGLITFNGGDDTGDPCEAFAYHGFNGLEAEVVRQIADWVLGR